MSLTPEAERLLDMMIEQNKKTSESVDSLSRSVSELAQNEKARAEREEARSKKDKEFHDFMIESKPVIERSKKHKIGLTTDMEQL